MTAAADVETATIVAERAGVVGHARRWRTRIDAMVASGRLSATDGSSLKDQICAFADEIAIGFHREDPVVGGAALRAALKPAVAAARKGEE